MLSLKEKTESGRKGFYILNNAQKAVALRFSGDKEVDIIINEVYDFIEDKKEELRKFQN